MFRFPLQIIQAATDAPELPGTESPAVIGDAKGMPVLTVTLAGTAECDNDRAAFVRDALNDPAGHFLQHCEKQRALAFARGDNEAREFWQRLEGSVKKARAMQ